MMLSVRSGFLARSSAGAAAARSCSSRAFFPGRVSGVASASGSIRPSVLGPDAVRPAAPPSPSPSPSPLRWRWRQSRRQSRSHYEHASPGNYVCRPTGPTSGSWSSRDWSRRSFTVGIGGPVGSGKTALVLALTRLLRSAVPMGVVTNDIFTQEDAEFLVRNRALERGRIEAVETGGCPHAAIREDVSANLAALERLTRSIRSEIERGAREDGVRPEPLLLCESGGDNLAANFSPELADYTVYVIDVAGGDKVPRKGGPGITQSDLLVVNKIDLAEAVGADLGVMERDATMMRGREEEGGGPTVFASVRNGEGVEEIAGRILDSFGEATGAAVPEVQRLAAER